MTNTYKEGLEELRRRIQEAKRLALKPPPKLSLSEWANTYGVLSKETSSEPGRFRSFPYQDGIMDAITDPKITTVTVMKSARVGYTRILDHTVGYFLHQDPSPILVVQPRVEDAEDYSRTEIAPMLRDTPVLAELTGELKSRDSDQRLLKRSFKNGATITFVGANSPGGFRRITTRIVCFDEVDGYPVAGAGNEGDQIKLGIKRTETFWNRKIILGSTPTVKGMSRIESSYEESDQREYYVPCPHCGYMQTIKWRNIKWGRLESGEPDFDNIFLVCEDKGCEIAETNKHYMVKNGEWRAHKPTNRHAGFKIWAGYSLFPNASWTNIVKEWYSVHRDPLLRKTFVNLVLGETWEDDAETVDPNSLMARAEEWSKVPLPVKVITAGVDVQDDRFEVEVVGWTTGEESWSLSHHIIYGDPAAPHIWKELEAYLTRSWEREDGAIMPIRMACIDSGGHHTQAVYAFVKNKGHRVRAIKGSENGPVWPLRASRNNKAKVHLWMVGTHSAKDSIYARLRLSTPGPGYCHFPKNRDMAYYDQLTSEVVKIKFTNGFKKRFYELPPNKRNEALDIRVYAYAALVSLNIRWGDLAAADAAQPPVDDGPSISVESESQQETELRKRIRERSRDGWLSRGKRGGWI